MGTILFRLAVAGRDPDTAGDGDIEAAFIRAGFSRLDASEFSEAVIESHNGIMLKSGSLEKNGIDVPLLVAGLRAAGLIVDVKEDNPEDYRPAGRRAGN